MPGRMYRRPDRGRRALDRGPKSACIARSLCKTQRYRRTAFARNPLNSPTPRSTVLAPAPPVPHPARQVVHRLLTRATHALVRPANPSGRRVRTISEHAESVRYSCHIPRSKSHRWPCLFVFAVKPVTTAIRRTTFRPARVANHSHDPERCKGHVPMCMPHSLPE